MKGQFARVANELRSAAPQVPLAAAAYVPPVRVQAAVKAVRAAQVVALTAYVFGEQLLPATPRVHTLLATAREQRFPLGLALYVSHLGCELAYSSSAFEVTWNGAVLFSKLKEGRFPRPGEIAEKVEAALAAQKGALVALDAGEDDAAAV